MTKRYIRRAFALAVGFPLVLVTYVVSCPIAVRQCSTTGDGFVFLPGPGPPGTSSLPIDSGEFYANRPPSTRLPLYRPIDK